MTDAPGDIALTLRALCRDMLPDAVETEKYGGVLFHHAHHTPEAGICGVFAYAAHVSLAFPRGSELPDPGGVLQGKGKLRRHLKFRSCAQITAQPTAELIRAAEALSLETDGSR